MTNGLGVGADVGDGVSFGDGNWFVLVVRKFLCWNVSSCASKSGRDIQLINACEEPDTTITFEGN